MVCIRGFTPGRWHSESELTEIVRAKQLCDYVPTVTDRSPKRFRFTLVTRLQGYALDVVESLCKAHPAREAGAGEV